jgi:MFS family permease
VLLARRSGTGPVPRARLLLIGCYVLMGLMTSGWLARIPAVRDQLHLSTATLGALLLVGSVGALLTVLASGVLVQRIGSRRSLVLSTGVLGAGYALMGIGPGAGSAAVLAVGIFLNGVGVSLANMVFNLESARIERAIGRTVIPHFHAGFSVGAVAGSAGGALASRLGISVTAQLTAVAAVAVVWRLASVRGVVLDPAADELAAALRPVAATSGGRLRSALSAWTERRTVLIGVVVLAASLSEGSANTWLSLAVVDGFRTPESMGGVVLGLFVAAMTVVRLLGRLRRPPAGGCPRRARLHLRVGRLDRGTAPAGPRRRDDGGAPHAAARRRGDGGQRLGVPAGRPAARTRTGGGADRAARADRRAPGGRGAVRHGSADRCRCRTRARRLTLTVARPEPGQCCPYA